MFCNSSVASHITLIFQGNWREQLINGIDIIWIQKQIWIIKEYGLCLAWLVVIYQTYYMSCLFFFVAQTVFDLITRDRENYMLSFFSMCEMGFLLNFFFSFVISANLQKSTGVLIGHLFLFYSWTKRFEEERICLSSFNSIFCGKLLLLLTLEFYIQGLVNQWFNKAHDTNWRKKYNNKQ